MEKYFNKRTVIYLLVSVVLSFVYSFIFGFNIMSLISGFTFMTCINALIALFKYSKSKGDFAMFSYNKETEKDYKEYRLDVIENSKTKLNPAFGSFLILIAGLIIYHWIY